MARFRARDTGLLLPRHYRWGVLPIVPVTFQSITLLTLLLLPNTPHITVHSRLPSL